MYPVLLTTDGIEVWAKAPTAEKIPSGKATARRRTHFRKPSLCIVITLLLCFFLSQFPSPWL
jgi:hypothetical protein